MNGEPRGQNPDPPPHHTSRGGPFIVAWRGQPRKKRRDHAGLVGRGSWPSRRSPGLRQVTEGDSEGRRLRQRDASMKGGSVMSKSLAGDPRLKNFGDHVRAHRAYLGLTQQDVATALQMTRSSIANIETGRQSLPLVIALDLATVLSTSLGVLVGEVDDPVSQQMAQVEEELADLEAAAVAAQAALREARQRARVITSSRGR